MSASIQSGHSHVDKVQFLTGSNRPEADVHLAQKTPHWAMSALVRKPPCSRKDSGWPLYFPNSPLRPGIKIFQIERQLLREKQTVATCLLCTNEGRLTVRSGHPRRCSVLFGLSISYSRSCLPPTPSMFCKKWHHPFWRLANRRPSSRPR